MTEPLTLRMRSRGSQSAVVRRTRTWQRVGIFILDFSRVADGRRRLTVVGLVDVDERQLPRR